MSKNKSKIPRKNLATIRVRAIKAHKAGMRTCDIAKAIGVHPNSVSRWIGLYNQGGSSVLRESKSSGRPKKIDCRVIAPELFKILKKPATKFGFETPLWNCPRLIRVLANELHVKVSKSTLWRTLKDIGLSYQKPDKRAMEQDSKQRREWITKTFPRLKNKAKKQRAVLLFEDEASLSLNPTVGKTWAKIARTPSIRVTSKRGSISIISAISPTGKLLFTIPKGNINSDAFIKFLKQVLKEIPRKKIYMVVDNCSSHKSRKTIDFLRLNQRMEIIYLPPYSPDFNPDELTWATLKRVEMTAHQESTKHGLRKVALGKMRKMQKKKSMIKAFIRKIDLT